MAATPSSSEGTVMTDIPTATTDRGQFSPFPARGGRLRRIAAATGLLAALTVTAACGGADQAAATPATAPDQSAASTPPTSDAALKQTMSGILEAHRADRQFVGAVLALRQADGTTVTATSGTQSLDGDSGAVDPDIPWGIGSIT